MKKHRKGDHIVPHVIPLQRTLIEVPCDNQDL